MRAALTLARRGLGRVFPNPAVGCLIVKEGIIVGRGWTQPGGRPHAETVALSMAGDRAKGAAAYVTLEPCSHHGKTAPCADALIGAGISRVVVAADDPDPRVDGAGLARLKAAGCDVTVGILEEEARALNAGFFSRMEKGRPLVTLKFATSLDGRIATASGESQWITGEAARRRGHLMRAETDAILIGIGTVLADDPALDCRLDGLADRSPIRIVLDRKLRLPLDSKLARTAGRIPLWIVTETDKNLGKINENGIEPIRVPDLDDLPAVMKILADKGLTRLLVEGGGKVHTSFLKAGLADRIAWFRSASLIGGDGKSVTDSLDIKSLTQSPRFRRRNILPLDEDVLETYERLD